MSEDRYLEYCEIRGRRAGEGADREPVCECVANDAFLQCICDCDDCPCTHPDGEEG